MFSKDLKEKFQRIFDLKNVTFDDPGESLEQETLFIAVESVKVQVKDAVTKSRIEGEAYCYANTDKLPFGYFSKCIRNAYESDVADIFFHEQETNLRIDNNIVRRSLRFVYFFTEQYDPRVGTISSINLETEV